MFMRRRPASQTPPAGPDHHRQGVIIMLLVESHLRKMGKDVMLHILSFCAWGWFEPVSVAAPRPEQGGVGCLAVGLEA